MHPSIGTRFRPSASNLHLFLLLVILVIASVTCQYESTEEERVQPNRIDEVSSNFVCDSEGYFADVTYGCQFYHVCENANSPYDKPSFVKHTFSCVNGTVFNQMSFTCTRYQDSIPCESSPNYFYLNKRNGDPKAYFLTDEDIKPTSSSRLSPLSSPQVATHRDRVVGLRSTASYANSSPGSTPVASNSRASLLQRSLDQPLESTISYGRPGGRMAGDYESSNSISISSASSYDSPKTSDRYEVTSKYSHIKPGVKYSMKPTKSKYEPVRKSSFNFELPQSTYIEDVRPESNYVSRSTETNKVQYRPMVSPYKTQYDSATPSKIDQLLAKYGTTTEANSKDAFGYHRAAIESPKVVPISAFTQPKQSAPFTPASFSKMYVENQKAAKYIGGSVMSAPQLNDIQIDNRDRQTLYYQAPKQQKMAGSQRQPKTSSYTAVPFPTSRPSLPSLSKEHLTSRSVSKYDSAPLDESLIKSNQYVVPSSIQIIEPENNSNSKLSLSSDSEPSRSSEPVKMSFVSKGAGDGQNSMADFGNLRVVKQVKGKNLLIDPSLENDPARDNIIAQVLEMLNKYN